MTERVAQLAPWALRVWWVVVGVAGSTAIDGAMASTDDGDALVLTILAGATWVVAAAAMFWPSVVTLTVLRVLVPSSVPTFALAWAGGGDPEPSAVALVAAVLATATVLLPELGRTFVQASAYGEEDRHLLRPPAAFLAAAMAIWLLMTGLVLAGTALVARDRTLVGIVTVVAGGAVAAWASRRWHRLSRRWLVVVPAGLVLHDHVVLAETLMVRRNDLASIELAPADTGAADLTGPAGGHALQVTTHESVTAVRAGTPKQPGGSAIHLTAYLVAPTRLGPALRAATRRN